MTRILACSDIHNNVGAVRKLRVLEEDGFDAVIVAGDFGTDAASEIMDILATFHCPVLYVHGNWDHGIAHDRSFGPSCHHLHHAPFHVGGVAVFGESTDGVDPEWERMRTTLGDDASVVKEARAAFLASQREVLARLVADQKDADTIFVSHYRPTKTRKWLPDVRLFLFGHVHGFADTMFQDQRFVNVSALDQRVTVAPSNLKRPKMADFRNINDGGYVVITHDRELGFSLESRRFNPNFDGWTKVEATHVNGAPEIDPN